VLTTVTTVSGNQTITTQTTLLPVNGSTTTPAPSSGTGEAGMSSAQIALIIICVLLLLLAIALTAALLWCWKTRQPKPLSAINLAYGNGAFAGNGDAAYKDPQRQDEPAEAEGQTATAAAVAAGDSAGAATEATVEQPNGAAGSPTAGQPNPMGSGLTLSRIMFEPAPYQSLAFSVIVPELSSGEEAADSENNGLPILRTAKLPPSPIAAAAETKAVPKCYGVATPYGGVAALFLGLQMTRMQTPFQPNELHHYQQQQQQKLTNSPNSPQKEYFPDFDDWQSEDELSNKKFNNYWCLPATVTVSSRL
uniref:CG32779 protein n=1 Tax=Macrostomum lignano TaxID=282301 RepID=A0A1I8GCK4_9PLAT